MHNDTDVSLQIISKRLLLRYYPVWLFFSILSANAYGPLYNTHLGTTNIGFFVLANIIMLFIYLAVVISLYMFKPNTRLIRLFLMTISMLISVVLVNLYFGLANTVSPAPFLGPPVATNIFIWNLVMGICVIWLFRIEETQCISETRIAAEKEKRIFNEKQLVESQLRLLQAQIEPHFLFNTLTSIVSLADKEPKKAKVMQTNFIQYLETTLSKTRTNVTTIGQEIKLICSYLDIYRVRMGKRLQYRIDLGDNLENIPFPPMLVQPIVENAIKHGLEPKVEGGKIAVRIEKNAENHLRWEITDTGLGLSDKANLGIGLSNVMERVESLYGIEGQVILEDNKPSGLRAILEVPLV